MMTKEGLTKIANFVFPRIRSVVHIVQMLNFYSWAPDILTGTRNTYLFSVSKEFDDPKVCDPG